MTETFNQIVEERFRKYGLKREDTIRGLLIATDNYQTPDDFDSCVRGALLELLGRQARAWNEVVEDG